MKSTKIRFMKVVLSLFLIIVLIAGSQVVMALAPGTPHIICGEIYTENNIDANDGTVTVYLDGKPNLNLTDIIGVNGDSNKPNWYLINLGNPPFPVWAIGDTLHIIAQKTVGGVTYTNQTTLVLNTEFVQVCNLTLPIPFQPGVTPTPTPSPTTGGAGEGATPAKTPSPTPIEEAKTYKNIAAGEEVKVELLGKELGITFKKEVPEAKITAKEFIEKPADVPDAPGIVFKYLEYTIENVSPEDIEKITILFDVPKSWIASENVALETIKLNRYYKGVWDLLPTEKVHEDAEYIHYSAEAEGLSIFAITGEKKTEVEAPAPAPAPAIWVWVVVGAVLAVLVAIAGVWYMKERKRE